MGDLMPFMDSKKKMMVLHTYNRHFHKRDGEELN